MFTKLTRIRQLTWSSLLLFPILFLAAPSSYAATYSLSDNDQLVKGCSGTIEIKIDTEGSNVMAGDSTLFIDAGEVSVNQVSIGSPLPMQIFNQTSGGSIRLSGARLPLSGTYNGSGTFGYINFTPSDTANSGSFTFSTDLNIENNLVDESISNVLTAAISKVYQFRDRYNDNVDGIGFCNPDVTAPNIQFITPPPSSSNIPVDSNVILTVTDNRAGVDTSSINITIDGQSYGENSPGVILQEESGLIRMEVDPATDFSLGQNVLVTTSACDSNNPANCTTKSMNFRVFTPSPPPPVCGDGVANYEKGEQCDDGNTQSGDGCSGLCLFEAPTPPPSRGASCNDGLHNQGETGIDCGGPCSLACPTCVDGTLNQGEESVDCGGPCQACGEEEGEDPEACSAEPEHDFVTICHYPGGDPEKAVTMQIPDSTFDSHQRHGDTLGSCPVFDLCSEALLLAAPDREEKALEEAESVIEKGVVEEQKSIDAPRVLTEVVSQIDICESNTDYATANFGDSSADTDGDGLSDRMECYAETNPVNEDTDGDGCSDFEELNHYYSNPVDNSDCKVEISIEEEVFSDVLITDPQPGWILSTKQPAISGKVPAGTVLVLVVATQSEQSKINALIKSIDALLALSASSSLDEVSGFVQNLNDSVSDMTAFIENYGTDFNSDLLASITQAVPTDLNKSSVLNTNTRDALETIKSNFLDLKSKPIVATASTLLQDTRVGDFAAKNFEEISNVLRDRQLYDLVATAYLNDGSQSSSKAVRFSVDTANTISKPVPRTIGGKLITDESIALDNLFFGPNAHAQVNAEGEIEVEIDEPRPTVTGETEFGSQVFAIWNSVVLASSVISDSEQGAFEVQAPRNLEVGSPHRVTLYAVKSEANNKIRSESVDVFFRIKAPGRGLFPLAAVGSSLILLMIAAMVVRRLVQMRSTMKLFKNKK